MVDHEPSDEVNVDFGHGKFGLLRLDLDVPHPERVANCDLEILSRALGVS
tara:strand:- start:611 stop:760 length:150 start_codon:yes stop_codon:yes gene_type:complete